MTQLQLSIGEIDLITEALKHRASRHESMGRAKPEIAGPHDRKAQAMRVLRQRLLQRRTRWASSPK